MKARTITTPKQIREEVSKEFKKQYQELYSEIASDIAQQTLSNVLITLEKSYGWKKNRLQGFIDELRGMCEIMDNPTALTHRFTTDDNIKYLNDKYGIDLKTAFTYEVV